MTTSLLETYEHNLQGYTGLLRAALLSASQGNGRYENPRGVFLSGSEAAQASQMAGMILVNHVVLYDDRTTQLVIYQERYPKEGRPLEVNYAFISDDGATATGYVVTVDELLEAIIPTEISFNDKVQRLGMLIPITNKLRDMGLLE